jgi:NAD(P)-dependent dehydrogenase (short-subunit alcohol dehydrogenase family)
VAFTPWEVTVDGQELQWQANYLGHYMLSLLLLPQLMSAAAHPSARGLKSRIVNVASTLHHVTTDTRI